jgi:hypothetical protein
MDGFQIRIHGSLSFVAAVAAPDLELKVFII